MRLAIPAKQLLNSLQDITLKSANFNNMPAQPFVHLHLHSEYSLLDGACKTKEIPLRAAALGMSVDELAIATRENADIFIHTDCHKNHAA